MIICQFVLSLPFTKLMLNFENFVSLSAFVVVKICQTDVLECSVQPNRYALSEILIDYCRPQWPNCFTISHSKDFTSWLQAKKNLKRNCTLRMSWHRTHHITLDNRCTVLWTIIVPIVHFSLVSVFIQDFLSLIVWWR